MTLKSKNAPYAIGFTILFYVGFALANGFDWAFAESMAIGKDGIKLENPVLSLGFYILTLVLTYLLPSEWKHRLIYTRCRNPLPGSRVFTELIDNDVRISAADLVAQHGVLPEIPEAQNALWYKIYKEKQKDDVVLNSHARWLLFRDLFAVSLVLLVPSSVFTFLHSGVKTGVVFTALVVLLVLALWLCARNTGERFACNVLAR